MASEKQIVANQLNALKSTGPRTDEGKDASRQNALTHGLTARKTIVLEDENEADFLTLRQALRAHFSTEGPLDQIFVDTLAAHLWRLQRIPKLEAMLLQAAPLQPPQDADSPGAILEPAIQQLLALQEFVLPKDVLGKISRHEAHLLREIYRLVKLLQPRQKPAIVAVAPPQPAHTPVGLPKQPMRSALRDDTHDRILQSLSQPRYLPG